MLPSKLAFVDIETTGMRCQYDRIIEIGIIRVEDSKIVQEYNQLINPESHLPHEITTLTGITSHDIENKPTFHQLKDQIYELLKDCIFVAHNARFDYSFLKSEFHREELAFSPKQCCTVKLSRYLFPTEHHHNLDAVMQRLNLICQTRHRAYSDAHLLYQFYMKAQRMFGPKILDNAINTVMKKPSTPIKLKQADLDTLPEQPGVYIFYDKNNSPLYVGKSINIKERVLSHFSADTRNMREMKISQQIDHIETITTAGEVGALFKEAKLVKDLLPLYNQQLRRKSELVALIQENDKNGYPIASLQTLTTIDPDSLGTFIGFFRSRRQCKDYLSRMVKEHSLCDKLVGLEKTTTSCFSYRLGICKGACIGKESPLKYTIRFLMAFANLKVKPWPFNGPITIDEYNPVSEKHDSFIVDKWCLIGSKEIQFDLDTYKILRRFFRNRNNFKKISNLKNKKFTEAF